MFCVYICYIYIENECLLRTLYSVPREVFRFSSCVGVFVIIILIPYSILYLSYCTLTMVAKKFSVFYSLFYAGLTASIWHIHQRSWYYDITNVFLFLTRCFKNTTNKKKHIYTMNNSMGEHNTIVRIKAVRLTMFSNRKIALDL